MRSNTGSIVMPSPSMYVGVHNTPKWVAPLATAVLNGEGNANEVVNGIAADADGDLVFYRKLSETDIDKYPDLIGADSVYIIMNLDSGN